MPTTTMMIRFEGLVCHIEGVTDVGRRAVLCDATAHDHESYVEVLTNQYTDSANTGQWTFPEKYKRDNVPYRRESVSGVRIEIMNPIQSAALRVEDSFHQRIPKLQAVEPRFLAMHGDFLQPAIPSSRQLGAYFDMSKGTLSAGPSEGFSTEFEPPHGWPKKHLGEWVQLEVSLETTDNMPPTFRFTNLDGSGSRDLKLNAGADLITFGNQLEADILGIPVPPTGRASHFGAYFDMAAASITNPDPPKPKGGLGLGVGCSNSSFP